MDDLIAVAAFCWKALKIIGALGIAFCIWAVLSS